MNTRGRVPWQRTSTPDTEPMHQPWRRKAACLGEPLEPFYEMRSGPGGGMTPRAKFLCGMCVVRAECLDMALDVESQSKATRFGVFGGLTARDRDRLWAAMQAEREGAA